jgi:hypothetical protein
MKSTLVLMGLNALAAILMLAMFALDPTDWTSFWFAAVNIAFVVIFVGIFVHERSLR